MASRVYKLVTKIPARGQFGAVNTTDTDIITEEGNGVRVDTHVTGTIEGARVDRRSSRFYPGITLEAASNYRRKSGYTLLSSVP